MKNTFLLFVILLFVSTQITAQNNAPEVTNVSFSQRTDGTFLVDIYYDINDSNGDTMFVTMEVSEDSGATWNFSSDSISGDVGAEILSGAGKHIVWDFGSEHPQTFGDAFRIKIIAEDRSLITGTVTDIDGNVYQTVKIGNQWWMVENLKVTHYSNGDSMPNVTDIGIWLGLTTGAYCNYNNDVNNVTTYGRLYNWFAVNDNRNIAPAGWHVPSDDEWKQLEMFLGMSQSQANATGFRGTDEGGKMKTTGTIQGSDGLWQAPNTGATNESGFSALPGGFRWDFGFSQKSLQAFFWSSTEYNSNCAWDRRLDRYISQVGRSYGWSKLFGFSVRCVKD